MCKTGILTHTYRDDHDQGGVGSHLIGNHLNYLSLHLHLDRRLPYLCWQKFIPFLLNNDGDINQVYTVQVLKSNWSTEAVPKIADI